MIAHNTRVRVRWGYPGQGKTGHYDYTGRIVGTVELAPGYTCYRVRRDEGDANAKPDWVGSAFVKPIVDG